MPEGRSPLPTTGAFPRRAPAFPGRGRRRGSFHPSARVHSAAAVEWRQEARGAAGTVPWTSVKGTGERERARRCQGRWYAHAAANLIRGEKVNSRASGRIPWAMVFRVTGGLSRGFMLFGLSAVTA